MQLLTFNVIAAQHAPTAVDVEIERVVIAGWAGRDPRAIRAHIDELAALGVAPPTTTPCFYRVAPALLTQAHSIDVLGTQSGGEIECVFVDSAAGTLVTLGSDHTDRAVEAYGVAVSKQMCAKPLGRDAWRYADVADHWDALEMRSWWAPRDGERIAYQHGAVGGLLAPDALWQRFDDRRTMPARCAMFGGTVAVHGAIATMRDGDAFEMELHDPVLGRSLRHRYAVDVLPVVA
ncbi:DUF2848 domain-containing protein [Burkholderia dolosa]|uniref:DUF2848 domain-containing protein n=1 Tax=Burkholderia dolosa TaxID=152500 RepID=A0A892IG19_9BURK|nr:MULTISPECIES: DUF2848 domain-containing protein [Burkholderia]AKE06191.1 hypothetical protein XM57_26950 [Burkholderia cepacia]AJY09493.1 hypothetical protein AK34_3699 [Burkholderia dolosa AU0158]AYZ95125.1 DUF2848 domain-containing protein [Burkholderia dolosa]ETP62810.1 hypothetical protein BDSB_21105 [Burkholderia dolosa PC543]MBR8060839.1 DUF2848 domain-containing protein [Burkholderia dolosa]